MQESSEKLRLKIQLPRQVHLQFFLRMLGFLSAPISGVAAYHATKDLLVEIA